MKYAKERENQVGSERSRRAIEVSKTSVVQPRKPDHLWRQCSKQTNFPKTYLGAPKGPESLMYPEETANPVESEISRTALKKSENLTVSSQDFKPKPKSCDRFWIGRRVVENKIHPRVTIYNSKAGLKVRDDSFKTHQKTKPWEKASKYSEMPPIDFIYSEKNPNSNIQYPSKFLLVQVQSREENFEKTKLKRAPGKASEQGHKFSYLSKQLTFPNI